MTRAEPCGTTPDTARSATSPPNFRGPRPTPRYQRPEALGLYEHFLVDGAWWDHVDTVAVHRIGPLLHEFPDEIEPVIRAWSTDDDMWRRRTSIICQIGSKADTDLGLLYDCIEPNLADTGSSSAKPSAGRCVSTPG